MSTDPSSPNSFMARRVRGLPSRIAARIACCTRIASGPSQTSSAGIPTTFPYRATISSFTRSTMSAAPRKMPRAARPEQTLTASLPAARAISDASGLRRLPLQQRIIEDRRANSPGTTGLRRSLLREDSEVFHSGWESVGEIIARLRG